MFLFSETVILQSVTAVILLICACYLFALAMDSFINMLSCCRYACFVMHCLVFSESSSQRCLHIIVSAMLCFLLSLKPVNETCYVYMVAIISSGPFGLWSVRDFCHMHLVDSCHALFCYDKFL